MKRDTQNAFVLKDLLDNLKFKLVLNMFRGNVNDNIGQQIVNVCNRHLYPSFDFLGKITYDDRVYEAILSNHVFIRKYPYTKTSSDLQDLVKNLIERQQESTSIELL
jgi:MinD-like ATPase involved in chromosome partitioning or flagellar assembly